MPLDILAEPTGAAYVRLIDVAARYCERFSLIWRPGVSCDPAIEIALAPHLASEAHVFEWPGTRLLGGPPALMRTYQLNSLSSRILKAANRLYAWQHSERAEDLALYAAGGQLWLGSVAHEGAAWLEDGAATAKELASIPVVVRARARSASLRLLADDR
jgi:hypothetical protein